eukprot:2214971-Prorocentrum_lima.AAC.1
MLPPWSPMVTDQPSSSPLPLSFAVGELCLMLRWSFDISCQNRSCMVEPAIGAGTSSTSSC